MAVLRQFPAAALADCISRTAALWSLVFFALLLSVPVAEGQGPTCSDGSTPTCPDGSQLRQQRPPCSGGPPVCADGSSAAPPDQTGQTGAPPDGGGAPQSSSAHAAPMLGDVGRTTASGTDARTSTSFVPGENIYGPFEAGFGTAQDNILASLGCSPGSQGHVAGGIDTQTAEQMVAAQCGVVLPRIQTSGVNGYISLLDECGGHTQEYHFHEKLSCLYDGSGGAHSTKAGEANDGKGIYGKWEHTDNAQLPLLDACGGHYGTTPDSAREIYHYHVQDGPPFTVGCFGPNDDGTLVTVEQCRAFYSGCDGNSVTVTTPQGSRQYDDWCPCYDAAGSNTGVAIVQLPVFTTAAPSAQPATQPPTVSPTAATAPPSTAPTAAPTEAPLPVPSAPTPSPTRWPQMVPTSPPTSKPTVAFTPKPTEAPTPSTYEAAIVRQGVLVRAAVRASARLTLSGSATLADLQSNSDAHQALAKSFAATMDGVTTEMVRIVSILAAQRRLENFRRLAQAVDVTFEVLVPNATAIANVQSAAQSVTASELTTQLATSLQDAGLAAEFAMEATQVEAVALTSSPTAAPTASPTAASTPPANSDEPRISPSGATSHYAPMQFVALLTLFVQPL